MLCLIYISKLSLSGLKTSIENNTKRLIEFLKINHSYSMYGIKNSIRCPRVVALETGIMFLLLLRDGKNNDGPD